jgi:ABC-type Na+ efflux pump permease subunit
MDISNSWTITRKDFSVYRKKKSVMAMLVVLPLAIGIGLPVLMLVLITRKFADYTTLSGVALLKEAATAQALLEAFSFFIVIIGSLMPIWLSSYAIVGEKVEKTLEPLLATPATDGELLLGKILAAYIPSIIAVFGSVLVFVVLTDTVLPSALFPQPFLPNPAMWTMIGTVIPVVPLLNIEACIIISSRVSDVRAAYQYAAITVVPYLLIYIVTEISSLTGVYVFTVQDLLIISGCTLLAILALATLVRRLFGREAILTRWK